MTEVDPPTARLADEIEAAAFRDFFAAAPPAAAQTLGLRTTEIAGANLLMATGVAQTIFNRVIGLGVRQAATEADLDAVTSAYRDAGIQSYWIHWTPTARPAELPGSLEARGFTIAPRRSRAKMIRGSGPVPAVDTGLDVRAVQPGEASAVSTAIRAAFGMPEIFVDWVAALAQRPGWQAVGAFADEKAVGGGYLFRQQGCGWLGLGGVRAEMRGRGAHRALITVRIRAAPDAGDAHVVTETGEPIGDEPNPSLANMVRCGFERVCSRVNYTAPTR